MPKYRIGGALNAARWPLIASLQGRTVISPSTDSASRAPGFFYGSNESADLQIPALMYCENVMPTAEGLMSVGFTDIVTGIPGSGDFDQAIILRDEDENNYLYCPGAGKNYILNNSTLAWASTDPIATTPSTGVTRAYVNGRTFICYPGNNVYEYNAGTNDFLPVTLTLPPGVVLADIVGIGASNNYLILATKITTYWSSLIDPTDFTPSTSTGAGGATPQDIKGQIVAVIGVSGGFIIFTVKNAVAAQYSNNIRAPFIFKEIAGAGGIAVPEQVTQDTTNGAQYAWTTNGLQKITLQTSEFLSAEMNDFIAGRRWNFWDQALLRLVVRDITINEFYTKIALVSNRFLCLSYTEFQYSNVPRFDFCFIYDLALKRWGHVKQYHTDVFALTIDFDTNSGDLTYNDLGTQTFNDLNIKTFNDLTTPATNDGVEPTSKKTLAFLTPDGGIKLLSMDYNKDLNHAGVAIFGRHQLVRQQVMQHQLTTVQGNYGDSPVFRAWFINSIDGTNLEQAVQMDRDYYSGQTAVYSARKTGVNFNLVFTGTFALSSYIAEVVNDGDIY